MRPSALAVFMLITSSNLVGCSTGRSEGLAPLRILVDVAACTAEQIDQIGAVTTNPQERRYLLSDRFPVPARTLGEPPSAYKRRNKFRRDGYRRDYDLASLASDPVETLFYNRFRPAGGSQKLLRCRGSPAFPRETGIRV